MKLNAYLVLENGAVFQGHRFGWLGDDDSSGDVIGEIVFTTGMTGYLETLTDPSYFGQIVVQTFPLIGNYGVIPEDFESSAPHVRAYVVRDACESPSNFRSQGKLNDFLSANHIVGLCGIDTRALTKIVREHGTMNAAICTSLPEMSALLPDLKSYRITDAVNAVSNDTMHIYSLPNHRYRVALWDYGAKQNIQRELTKRGCEVISVPAHFTAQQIIELAPDGIMLSNGPGDPAENVAIINELRKLCEKRIPTLGICLGHQLLALSQGAKTEKLKYGHRGANQPVLEYASGRVHITSQNHGYAVVADSLPKGAKLSHINVNDGSCEGVVYEDMPAFSVQFHPEASGGPLDTSFLFDRFLALMSGGDVQCR